MIRSARILGITITIRILEKLSRPSSVKFGVPSSINDRSVRYIPRYGMHGGSQRCNASRMFRNRPSVDTSVCSFSIVCLVCKGGLCENLHCHSVLYKPNYTRTVLATFSQVRFNRNTDELVNAAQICSTPLKLWKQRHISATAAHFSMMATLFGISGTRSTSEATNRLMSLKCLVISRIWNAFVF